MTGRVPAWTGWYLVAQAAATALWWVWMFGAPEARAIFFADDSYELLRRFAVPDLLVFGGGSLLAGGLVLRSHPAAKVAAWFTLGAATYATLGALAANWPIGTKPVADVAMALTVGGTAWVVRVLGRAS
ncbi:MAG: hypothetical protein H6534_08220 [Chthonomonadaceae bacterium]|nr:hypothetical protein [Chthonomonadaceae bacterium]